MINFSGSYYCIPFPKGIVLAFMLMLFGLPYLLFGLHLKPSGGAGAGAGVIYLGAAIN